MLIDHFYSDPHYGHQNIIKHAFRPFTSMEQMTLEFIQRYNAKVGKDQTVLWCGDCSFRLNEFADIMTQLNGHKILIRGNHDKSAQVMASFGFSLVLDEATLQMGGRTCTVSHFPYAGSEHARGGVDNRHLDRRPTRRKGEVLIHGHTHSKTKRHNNMIHVGVDAWDFAPASFAEVEELVRSV